MSCSRTWVIATAFAAMSVTVAAAADMRPLPPPPPFEGPTVEEYASGWYLRGDVGYRVYENSGATALVGPQPSNVRIDDSYFLGAGVGYKLHWFRADLTADYGTQSDFFADTAVAPNDYSMKVDNVAVLTNAYIDLGTWWGFTPYVGGGIGAAFVRTKGFDRLTTQSTLPPQVNSRWNFAWAAMAGIGYQISANLLVDIGYRYLNLGEVQTEMNNVNNRLTVGDLSTHELRVGLRYMFD